MPADEQHAEADRAHPDCLPGARARPERDNADEEDEHRREPARDGVDERELGVAVRTGKKREVRELQGRGGHEVRPDLRFDVPEGDRNRSEDDDGRTDRDRGRRLGILLPREQQIPERVQEGSAEREGERGRGH